MVAFTAAVAVAADYLDEIASNAAMTIYLCTGSAGPSSAMLATAAALHTAAQGQPTLVLSIGPTHAIGSLLGTTLSGSPRQIGPMLSALALDVPTEVASLWEDMRSRLPSQLSRLAGEELPLFPGLDMLFGLRRLRESGATYSQIFVDAGPHDDLIRTLALPDSLRWGIRLLVGLDRGPGQNPGSVMQALLPTSFLPLDIRDGLQQLRLAAEQARTDLLADGQVVIWYALRPDQAALTAARLAVPALQLYGVRLPLLPVGPLLPGDSDDARIRQLVAQETAILEQASQIWSAKTVLPFSYTLASPPTWASMTPAALPLGSTGESPLRFQYGGVPAIVFDLPGLPRGALQISVSGDELIIRLGPYRRHLLLPAELRQIGSIKATRDGDLLIVQQRPA